MRLFSGGGLTSRMTDASGAMATLLPAAGTGHPPHVASADQGELRAGVTASSPRQAVWMNELSKPEATANSNVMGPDVPAGDQVNAHDLLALGLVCVTPRPHVPRDPGGSVTNNPACLPRESYAKARKPFSSLHTVHSNVKLICCPLRLSYVAGEKAADSPPVVFLP